MHYTAQNFGKLFFDVYLKNKPKLYIVEIGSLDVGGSIRQLAPDDCKYVGVDFVDGKGVDIVIQDPYKLPFEDESVDVCMSTSCFEHSEFFWLLFNEVLRILKPNGFFYLSSPSNGTFHRYPVDCWRFYPDSGVALQNWGRRSGFDVMLIESFIGKQHFKSNWNDFVAVFLKNNSIDVGIKNTIQDNISIKQYTNGIIFDKPGFNNLSVVPEDQEDQEGHFVRRAIRKLQRYIIK